MSSHKLPYGDTGKIQTLSEHEYNQLWSELKNYNLEKDAPITGPTIFVYPEDNYKNEELPQNSKRRK